MRNRDSGGFDYLRGVWVGKISMMGVGGWWLWLDFRNDILTLLGRLSIGKNNKPISRTAKLYIRAPRNAECQFSVNA